MDILPYGCLDVSILFHIHADSLLSKWIVSVRSYRQYHRLVLAYKMLYILDHCIIGLHHLPFCLESDIVEHKISVHRMFECYAQHSFVHHKYDIVNVEELYILQIIMLIVKPFRLVYLPYGISHHIRILLRKIHCQVCHGYDSTSHLLHLLRL